MKDLFSKEKFCEILSQKLEEKGYNTEEFAKSEIGQIIIDSIISIPIEDRYYSEDDMDYQIKIILRLLNKFSKELLAEYNEEYYITILDTLNKEQNKIMPFKWYNYTYFQP